MYKSSDEIIEIISPIFDSITIERPYNGRWNVSIVDNKTLSTWRGYGKTIQEALIDTIVFIDRVSELINFDIKEFYK